MIEIGLGVGCLIFAILLIYSCMRYTKASQQNNSLCHIDQVEECEEDDVSEIGGHRLDVGLLDSIND